MYRVIWELADGNTQGETPETESLDEAIEWLAAKAREFDSGPTVQGFNWIQIEATAF